MSVLEGILTLLWQVLLQCLISKHNNLKVSQHKENFSQNKKLWHCLSLDTQPVLGIEAEAEVGSEKPTTVSS